MSRQREVTKEILICSLFLYNNVIFCSIFSLFGQIICKDTDFFVILHPKTKEDKMNKRFLMFAAAASMFFGSSAKVKLAHLISDGMVIQQQSDVSLWGWDKPGKTIKVTTSWSSATYEAKTDKQGKWLVSVKSPEASFTPLS